MNKIYLSLGSNLGNKKKNLQQAIRLVNQRVGDVTNLSGIYLTEPWGFRSNDYFLNMVVEVLTDYSAPEVLEKLLMIEKEMGREREAAAGYSSRLIDIDILFYGNEIVKSPSLVIPHKHISGRKFILRPLCDIAPEMKHPESGKEIRQLLDECTDTSKVELQ
ncbi:MAG: 2-amino-4-hydroxy-6-hydroxymethyldihydropteridine diphosphokinase [Prolixibacteraceae bacterium]|nr:2-amino-4-hydroxy-6-hydroxymethyldihydropteridine diphosphokinase [Prolixibacteraceae bacterium]